MHLGYQDLLLEAQSVETDISGLTAGSIVLTLDGELPVEHLSAGDKIITRDCGVALLKDVVVTETVLAPVTIKAGSLGHTRPDHDIMVAPGTEVHIRDWRAEALFGQKTADVPARRLVDREFVAEAAPRRMRIFTLVFDTPHIVYADGLEIIA